MTLTSTLAQQPSNISVVISTESAHFSWSLACHRRARRNMDVITVASSFLFLPIGISVIAATLVSQRETMYFGLAALAIWLVAGVLAIMLGRKVLWRARPESVILRPEELVHDPGEFYFLAHRTFGFHDGPRGFEFKYWCWARIGIPQTIPRKHIRRFALVNEENAKLLYCRYDTRSIEIGSELSDDEKDWLYSILQQWLDDDKHRSN